LLHYSILNAIILQHHTPTLTKSQHGHQAEESKPHNSAELNKRFLDAIFNIPLQKEIESIEFNNDIARCVQHLPENVPATESLRRRREITILILDPACSNNAAVY